jgi:hypothetical protein
MWIRDFLPEDMPFARILTYGNTSRLAGPDLAVSTLRDLAEEFLNNLLYIRRKVRFLNAQYNCINYSLSGRKIGGNPGAMMKN